MPCCWQAWSTDVPGGTVTVLPLRVKGGMGAPPYGWKAAPATAKVPSLRRVMALGTTMASLIHTTSHRRQLTHFASSTTATPQKEFWEGLSRLMQSKGQTATQISQPVHSSSMTCARGIS